MRGFLGILGLSLLFHASVVGAMMWRISPPGLLSGSGSASGSALRPDEPFSVSALWSGKIVLPQPMKKTPRSASAESTGNLGETGFPAGHASSVESAYLEQVYRHLAASRYYPPASRRLREQGRVEVRFELWADGSVHRLELAVPSPWSRLNQAALETVRRARKFAPLPEELRKSSLSLSVPIDFVLE